MGIVEVGNRLRDHRPDLDDQLKLQRECQRPVVVEEMDADHDMGSDEEEEGEEAEDNSDSEDQDDEETD